MSCANIERSPSFVRYSELAHSYCYSSQYSYYFYSSWSRALCQYACKRSKKQQNADWLTRNEDAIDTYVILQIFFTHTEIKLIINIGYNTILKRLTIDSHWNLFELVINCGLLIFFGILRNFNKTNVAKNIWTEKCVSAFKLLPVCAENHKLIRHFRRLNAIYTSMYLCFPMALTFHFLVRWLLARTKSSQNQVSLFSNKQVNFSVCVYN